MSECPDEVLFIELLQGVLDEDSRAELNDHLDVCPSCSQLVVELAQLAFPAGQDDSLVPGSSMGRYEIIRQLGSGGMGVVFEARDTQLGRRVAIKLLRGELLDSEQVQDYAERLLREAKLLASLSHPNVVAVHDVGDWEGSLFVAMELVDGQTMRAWQQEQQDWRVILEAYLQAAEGLSAAHKAGLVHRDVKPENLLIDAEGRVRVTDFGLARSISPEVSLQPQGPEEDEAELSSSRLTQTGAIMGTPAYMAPEQHLGEEVDEAADQFSFCASLYEALYGHRAFAGKTRVALARATLAGELRSPSRQRPVPGEIFKVLARGLSSAPERRFGSMRELVQALQRASKPRAIAQWGVGAMALLVLFAGGALAIDGLGRTREPVPDPKPAVELTVQLDQGAEKPVSPADMGAAPVVDQGLARLEEDLGVDLGAARPLEPKPKPRPVPSIKPKPVERPQSGTMELGVALERVKAMHAARRGKECLAALAEVKQHAPSTMGPAFELMGAECMAMTGRCEEAEASLRSMGWRQQISTVEKFCTTVVDPPGQSVEQRIERLKMRVLASKNYERLERCEKYAERLLLIKPGPAQLRALSDALEEAAECMASQGDARRCARAEELLIQVEQLKKPSDLQRAFDDAVIFGAVDLEKCRVDVGSPEKQVLRVLGKLRTFGYDKGKAKLYAKILSQALEDGGEGKEAVGRQTSRAQRAVGYLLSDLYKLRDCDWVRKLTKTQSQIDALRIRSLAGKEEARAAKMLAEKYGECVGD